MTAKERDLLEALVKLGDFPIEHPDDCGQCFMMSLYPAVAKEFLAADRAYDKSFDARVIELWQAGKYFRLWRAEGREGFKRAGWLR